MAESSVDIQAALTSASKNLDSWTAELMKLNGSLVSAKVGKRGGIKKAIKNAEQQINGLEKQIRKLNDDLTKVARTEVRKQDDILLAEKGIDKSQGWKELAGKGLDAAVDLGGKFLESKSGGSTDPMTKKSTTGEAAPEGNKIMGIDAKYVYIVGALLVALLMFKKK